MKFQKKKFLIIIITILLITCILFLGFKIYKLSKERYHTAIILEINSNTIVVDCISDISPYELYNNEEDYGHVVDVNGQKYVTSKYIIDTDNVKILDEENRKISIEDLKIGDLIKITNEEKYEHNNIYISNTLPNVKEIKVIKDEK